nr:MAG TPA: hypothetical protein [Caudoviricetes sp.]
MDILSIVKDISSINAWILTLSSFKRSSITMMSDTNLSVSSS